MSGQGESVPKTAVETECARKQSGRQGCKQVSTSTCSQKDRVPEVVKEAVS